MFVPYDAAQYRALDDAGFHARFAEIKGLMEADTLPEGVTDDMLFAEADMLKAENERRAKRNAFSGIELAQPKVDERNAKAASILSGAGNVIASNKQERGFKAVSEQPFSTTREYRKALSDHIAHVKQMPADMAYRAYMERANTDVEINADYSHLADPATFTNEFSGLVIAPTDLSEEVIKEVREQSVLLPKVNQTYLKGMYAVSEMDLQVTGAWIGDNEVSPYQADYDPEVFTWTWHQFECRFARSFLAEAIMRDNYKEQLAPAMAECYALAMDTAILSGNGTTQPKGILTDTRLVGSDGKGKTTDGTPDVKGKALVISVNDGNIDDWRFWASLLWNDDFNRLYRNRGELIIADGTWGNHINVLRDEVNRPIVDINPLNQETPLTLRGVGPVSTVANGVLKTYDQAEVGDVIGFYGNLRNYTMNFQPGMPLTTVSWADHETNTNKTKLLLACDGRVSNPFGWVILKKAASA